MLRSLVMLGGCHRFVNAIAAVIAAVVAIAVALCPSECMLLLGVAVAVVAVFFVGDRCSGRCGGDGDGPIVVMLLWAVVCCC